MEKSNSPTISNVYLAEIDFLVKWLSPTTEANKKRRDIARMVSNCVCERLTDVEFGLYSIGSSSERLYLPESDLDVVVITRSGNVQPSIESRTKHNDDIIMKIMNCLCMEAIHVDKTVSSVMDSTCISLFKSTNIPGDVLIGDTEKIAIDKSNYVIRNIEFINARTKVLNCKINNIDVDITVNRPGALSSALFLEEVDNMIGFDHLFKRSVLLIKSWCLNESSTLCGKSIIGSKEGMLSSYALCVLVIYIFNKYPVEMLVHPFVVFRAFLYTYSDISMWDSENVMTISGPISHVEIANKSKHQNHNLSYQHYIHSHHHENRFQEIQESIQSTTSTYSIYESNSFPKKICNIQDPTDSNNNIGYSVNRYSLQLIHLALSQGHHQLEAILPWHPHIVETSSTFTDMSYKYNYNEIAELHEFWFLKRFFPNSFRMYYPQLGYLRPDMRDHPLQHNQLFTPVTASATETSSMTVSEKYDTSNSTKLAHRNISSNSSNSQFILMLDPFSTDVSSMWDRLHHAFGIYNSIQSSHIPTSQVVALHTLDMGIQTDLELEIAAVEATSKLPSVNLQEKSILEMESTDKKQTNVKDGILIPLDSPIKKDEIDISIYRPKSKKTKRNIRSNQSNYHYVYSIGSLLFILFIALLLPELVKSILSWKSDVGFTYIPFYSMSTYKNTNHNRYNYAAVVKPSMNVSANHAISTTIGETETEKIKIKENEEENVIEHWVRIGNGLLLGLQDTCQRSFGNSKHDQSTCSNIRVYNGNIPTSNDLANSSQVWYGWKHNNQYLYDQYMRLSNTRKYFSIPSASMEDAGVYEIYAVTPANDTEHVIAKTIVRIGEPPSVRTRPIYSELMKGSRLLIQLQFEGVPEPTFEWRKNGFVVSSPDYRLNMNTLTIDSVNKTHIGTYSCMLRNFAGEFLWLEATVVVKE